MIDRAELHEALTHFVRALTRSYDIGRVLYELTERSVAVLGCDEAGVAIRSDRGLEFVTATDETVAHLEQRQVEGDEGPCHEAYRSGGRVVCADLEAVPEDRWSGYRGEALRRGARAVAGIPLTAKGQTIGALNLYWSEPHECSEDELEAAQLLADMAAAYVTNLVLLEDAERINRQLQHALDSRVVIEQAKGMLARTHEIDPDAAFERLRSFARPRRESLHDVARQVVAGELEL